MKIFTLTCRYTGLEKEELQKTRGWLSVPPVTESNHVLPSNNKIQNELFNELTRLWGGGVFCISA